jgi:hypothetical protein
MAKKKLSMRAQREAIELELRADPLYETSFQRCPYTCAVVRARYRGAEYLGVGFSKVRWPDSFEPDYGIELARNKAFADISKRILAEQIACKAVHAKSVAVSQVV